MSTIGLIAMFSGNGGSLIPFEEASARVRSSQITTKDLEDLYGEQVVKSFESLHCGQSELKASEVFQKIPRLLPQYMIYKMGDPGNSLVYGDFKNIDLKEKDFSKRDLRRTIFRNTNLCHSNLKYTNLTDSNLSEANLTKAYLSEANLTHANLTKTKLIYVRLVRANLEGANCQYTDFRDSDLRGVNFHGADTKGANFENTIVEGLEQFTNDLYGSPVDIFFRLGSKCPDNKKTFAEILAARPVGNNATYLVSRFIRLTKKHEETLTRGGPTWKILRLVLAYSMPNGRYDTSEDRLDELITGVENEAKIEAAAKAVKEAEEKQKAKEAEKKKQEEAHADVVAREQIEKAKHERREYQPLEFFRVKPSKKPIGTEDLESSWTYEEKANETLRIEDAKRIMSSPLLPSSSRHNSFESPDPSQSSSTQPPPCVPAISDQRQTSLVMFSSVLPSSTIAVATLSAPTRSIPLVEEQREFEMHAMGARSK